jgi:hypothetical protein
LDSATEFLVGSAVGSLSAKLPYPAWASNLNEPSFNNHPSNIFAKAFSEGLSNTALRISLGNDWPLFEFWSDKVVPLRKVMDEFTEPLMEEAIAKRNLELSRNGTDIKDDGSETLLDHLVKHTEGKESPLNLLRHCLIFWNALDKSILKDEVVLIDFQGVLLLSDLNSAFSLLTFLLPDATQYVKY